MNKIEIEFPIHASPSLLFQYFSAPSNLSEWFADNVNSRGKVYQFIWDGSEEEAKVLAKSNDERLKLKWTSDEDAATYFEFKIQVDELTNDVSLIITDFYDDGDEDEVRMYWENSIGELKHVIGA
jgi:uncharacterized protein YndB with AHSA1/START domain